MVNVAFEDFAIRIKSPYETNSCLIRTSQEVLPIKRTQVWNNCEYYSRAGKIGYPLALLNEVRNLQGLNQYLDEMKLKCQRCTLSYDKMNQ